MLKPPGSHCAITCDNFEVPIAKCDNIKHVIVALEKGPIYASNELSRLAIAQCELGLSILNIT